MIENISASDSLSSSSYKLEVRVRVRVRVRENIADLLSRRCIEDETFRWRSLQRIACPSLGVILRYGSKRRHNTFT